MLTNQRLGFLHGRKETILGKVDEQLQVTLTFLIFVHKSNNTFCQLQKQKHHKLQSEETDHQKHCTDMFRSAALQNVQQRSRNWPDPGFNIQKTINQLLQIEKEVGFLLCTPKISVFQHICCRNLMWSLPTWKWIFPMFHMGTSFRVGNPWLVKKSPNELQPMSNLHVLIACSFK